MSLEFNPSLINQPIYAISELQNKYQQLINDGIDVINCTIGDPKDDTPSGVQQRLLESLAAQSFSQYPSYIGSHELRSAISEWSKQEYQASLSPDEHIISCNGTKEAIFSFPLLFDWAKGQHILVPSLSYPVYQMAASYLDIETVLLSLSKDMGFLPDLDSIPEKVFKSAQIFWINSPHNPTTAVAPIAYLEKLISLAEKHQFIVCSDECYNEFYVDEKPASVLSIDSDYWVCFRSLSKRSHMTGYRSGAILSKNKPIIKYLKKLRSPMGVGSPSFIQDAATWAWVDDVHVTQHRNLYNNKRLKVKKALEKAGHHVFGGSAGFYMWVSSDNHATSESLSNWFLDRGILVTPGTVFGDDGNPYIRLVFCLTDDEINKLCQLLLT